MNSLATLENELQRGKSGSKENPLEAIEVRKDDGGLD